MPFKVFNAECLECGYIWTAVCDCKTDSTKLECPKCHKQNSQEMKWQENKIDS